MPYLSALSVLGRLCSVPGSRHFQPLGVPTTTAGSTWATLFDAYVTHHGYLTLFVAMYIEGLGLPVPAELLFIPAGFLIHSRDLAFFPVVLSATLGGLIGNLTGYALARFGGAGLVSRYGTYIKLGESQLEQVREWFSRYGGKTIFISRFVGFIRAAAIVSAGIGRMPVLEFAANQAAAGLAWNFLWAFAAWVFGRRVTHMAKHFGTTTVALGGLALATLAVAWWWRRRRARAGATGFAITRRGRRKPVCSA